MISGHNEKKVDKADRRARYLITGGGWLCIIAVGVIILFIIKEVIPLLAKPQFEKSGEWMLSERISPEKALAAGTDEYREIAFRLTESGNVDFISLKNGATLEPKKAGLPDGEKITSAAKIGKKGWIVYGTSRGRVGYLSVEFDPVYSAGERHVTYSVRNLGTWEMGEGEEPINTVSGAVNEDGLFIIAAAGGSGLRVLTYDSDSEETELLETGLDGNEVTALAISPDGMTVLAGMSNGDLAIMDNDDGDVTITERIKAGNSPITAISFLMGGEAAITGDRQGSIFKWLRVRHVKIKNTSASPEKVMDIAVEPGEERIVIDRNYYGMKTSPSISMEPAGMRFIKVSAFEGHSSALSHIAPSPRNKGFITAARNGSVFYHYSTSGKTYAVTAPNSSATAIAFSPKSNGVVMLAESGLLYDYELAEGHPEVTLKTLFSYIWYEGYNSPDLVWQSTGGSDEFEPKFSLWPLIFGTLKGTFYAMFFSIPVALLGAIYLSQMAPAALRSLLKPLIEIMAAVPSVVVGFLAGLWFAPMVDRNLAGFFLSLITIPAAWLAAITIWMLLPEEKRSRMTAWKELFFLAPLMVAALFMAFQAAGTVEDVFFAGDIKQWLYNTLNVVYDPRNSIVVGFALGFAVIPIIFTISEDALSSVPPSLTSASYALAASKWQTALYVVLPAASPGIFAAIMLGLGRAVGETMIVLMATGNTPIMDLSPFNGFRAMSASIAVEMPEAPVGGSLYRILFLVGLLLFMFTFLINTIAEVVSSRLRKKYSRF